MQVVELSENSQPSKSESQAESMCDVQSITSSQSMTSSQSRGDQPVGDLYSEEAMDELERLGDEENDVTKDVTTSVKDSAAATASSSIANSNESQSKSESTNTNRKDNGGGDGSPQGEDSQESRDTFEEATPEDISLRRRSWHEASNKPLDGYSSKKEDAGAKPEVKLRKAGAGVDVTRPGSLKKLRSSVAGAGAGEAKTSKVSPSPVKATYRPVSMPVDNLVAQMENEAEGHKTPEEANSGEKLCCVFRCKSIIPVAFQHCGALLFASRNCQV